MALARYVRSATSSASCSMLASVTSSSRQRCPSLTVAGDRILAHDTGHLRECDEALIVQMTTIELSVPCPEALLEFEQFVFEAHTVPFAHLVSERVSNIQAD